MVTAYYSIVRYLPDIFRKEFVNIGVIVAFPSLKQLFFEIQFSETRLKSFDPRFKRELIDEFRLYLTEARKGKSVAIFSKDGKEEKLDIGSQKYLEELYRTSLTSKVQLSQVSWVDFEVESIEQAVAENYISDLVKRFVDLPRREMKVEEKTTMFKSQLKQQFKKLNILGREPEDIKNHKVIYNYKIKDFDWKYDFALKNGKLQLIETLDLTIKSLEQKSSSIKETALTYLKFSGATKKYGRGVKNVTILKADNTKMKELKKELDILHDVSTIYNFRSADEKKKFFHQIERDAYVEKLDL